MRNLKRALSLALASIMLLGMMVVGSSAKGFDDFTDKDEVVNKDAVAVTSAIGMFAGYEDGSFKPENVVTRAEMAVIISTMLYGAGFNAEQFAGTKVFTDVPAWAEGYVNLCSSLGIVAGVGDGKFDPNATVTTAQAVLMLCRALGYFQNSKDFGSDWMLAATAKGTQLGLYGDLKLSATAGLSRDNVAELVFNALTKTVPVQYNELLGVYYNENKGIVYSLTFYYTDTLGYKNFDLVYRSNENTDYGRPGTTWGTGSYRGNTNTSAGNDNYGLNEDGSLIPDQVKMTSDDEIITVADTPDFTYTNGTKQNVIYKAVGKSVVENYDWDVFMDGAEQTANLIPANNKDDNYTYTGKGATTEVYVDDVNDTVTVVMINYYLGEVTSVKTDDDGEYATIRVRSTTTKTSPIDERNIYAEGFAKDEYVVFTVDVDDNGDSFIASIADPATAEGTVTRVSRDSDPEGNQGSYVRLGDDTKYTYSSYTASDVDGINDEHPTLDIEYRLFLDPNGYVLGFQALEDYYDNYLYVEAVAVSLNTITAKVVLTDGTSKTVEIDDEYIDTSSTTTKFDANNNKEIAAGEIDFLKNKTYAYTEDNGVYTLRQLVNMGVSRPSSNRYKDTQDRATGNGSGGVNIYNDAAYIKSGINTYIVDEDTAFVDVDERILYTGFENVPDYKDDQAGDPVKFWGVDSNDDGVLDVVFIDGGVASNSNETYFYVKDINAFETYNKNKVYKERDLYIDGEATKMIFTQGANNDITSRGLYVVKTTNGDGVVTKVEQIVSSSFSSVLAVGNRTFSLNNDKDFQLTTNSNTRFVVATYDLQSDGVRYKNPVVAPGSLDDLNEDDNYTTTAYVAKYSNNKKTADLVYIEKREIASYDREINFTGSNFTVTDGSSNCVVTGGNKILVNDNQTVTFKVAAVGSFAVSSVKLGDQVLTPDANGVYTVRVTTRDLTIAVETVSNQTFDVTVTGYENAFVTVNGEAYADGITKVADGKDATIVVEPMDNHDIAKVVVNGRNIKADASGIYTYTVSKVAADVSVVITYVEAVEKVSIVLNAPEASVTVNGRTYLNGQTIAELAVGESLTFKPEKLEGVNKTLMAVTYNGATPSKVSATDYTLVAVASMTELKVEMSYAEFGLNLNKPGGWAFVTGYTAPSTIKTDSEDFKVRIEQDTAANLASLAGVTFGVSGTMLEVKSSELVTEGKALVGVPGILAATPTINGALAGTFADRTDWVAAVQAGLLYTDNTCTTQVNLEDHVWANSTEYYMANPNYVAAQKAVVELTIGVKSGANINGDLAPTLTVA